jgi:phosphotransferase system  glucose/maltose/N-acetylglucosamine-specific IIC component
MLGVTFFGLIFTPVFYVLLREFELKILGKKPEELKQATPEAAE